jgi:HSP20 family protein
MAALTRWNPFDEIASLWPRDLFNRDVLGRVQPDGGLMVEWSPRCDVTDTETEIIVHAELPGVEAKDMEVTMREGILTVKGEKRTEKE